MISVVAALEHRVQLLVGLLRVVRAALVQLAHGRDRGRPALRDLRAGQHVHADPRGRLRLERQVRHVGLVAGLLEATGFDGATSRRIRLLRRRS